MAPAAAAASASCGVGAGTAMSMAAGGRPAAAAAGMGPTERRPRRGARRRGWGRRKAAEFVPLVGPALGLGPATPRGAAGAPPWADRLFTELAWHAKTRFALYVWRSARGYVLGLQPVACRACLRKFF